MVRGKLAEAGAPERGADPAAKRMRLVPTLQEILERANKAMGGSEAWKSANTIMMKGRAADGRLLGVRSARDLQESTGQIADEDELPQDLRCGSVRRENGWLEDAHGGYHEFKARSWRTVCGGRNFQNSLA